MKDSLGWENVYRGLTPEKNREYLAKKQRSKDILAALDRQKVVMGVFDDTTYMMPQYSEMLYMGLVPLDNGSLVDASIFVKLNKTQKRLKWRKLFKK